MSKVTFNVQIKDVEQVNPIFSRCKVYICYSDLNRNNSVISRELINKRIDTLKNCPIVGEYSKDKKDFLDHGGKVELGEDGDYEYVVTTIPYGLVPESSEITWETVDGKEYLTCTGFLWASRYPEVLKAVENQNPQSMEIEQVKGEFNAKKEFVITDFVFSALTILGRDVEPCFEEAKIVAYALDKEEFTKSFNQMIDELKFTMSKVNHGSVHEDTSIDNKNMTQKEDEVVAKTKKEIATEFSLTVNQLYDEISRALSEIKYETTNWYGEEVEVSRFYLRDFDDQFAYAVDRQNDYIDVKIAYTMSGDNVSFDIESVKRIKYVPTDWEGEPEQDDMAEKNFALKLVKEFEEVTNQFSVQKKELQTQIEEKENALLALNGQFTQLQEEVANKDKEIETLVGFKKEVEGNQRKEKVDELFATYSTHLSKEDIEEFRKKESSFEKVEEFEKEIKAFVLDKVIANVKNNTASYSKIGIPPQEDNSATESSSVWDRLDSKNKN